MKDEFKEWFLTRDRPKQGFYTLPDRKYSFINFHISEVPFHTKLRDYIYSLHSLPYGEYDVYHLHFWEEGDFFNEHTDNNFRRIWAYVCELKPSDCNTSLLVEGKEFKEGVFDSNTLHSLPPIKKGTRISLTVFGSEVKKLM